MRIRLLLPGSGRNVNFFSVIWHVEAVIDDFSHLRFTLHLAKQVQNYPFLKDANFRIIPLLSVNSEPPKKKKLSPKEQAKLYSKLLDSEEVKSRAELARKIGVSRARIIKVLSLVLFH